MCQVALAEKPLEVAVGGGTNVLAAQRGLFVAIAPGIRAVALGAVFPVEECAAGYGFRMGRKRVDAGVILFRYAIPMRVR